MGGFFKNNGLSLVLLALFLLFLGGQAASGFYEYNNEQSEHGQETVGFGEYLTSGHFLEATFENWESEFLQMALYVILTAFLYQKGSSESKDPDGTDEVDEDPRKRQHDPDAPWPVRKGGLWLKLYNHSLSLVLTLLFLLSFLGHAIWGLIEYNAEQVEHGSPPIAFSEWMTSSQFWFQSFQNWQSEFLAVAAIVLLSIWLRQRGSPESKRVAAPYDETPGS